jgi:hypothetical protein
MFISYGIKFAAHALFKEHLAKYEVNLDNQERNYYVKVFYLSNQKNYSLMFNLNRNKKQYKLKIKTNIKKNYKFTYSSYAYFQHNKKYAIKTLINTNHKQYSISINVFNNPRYRLITFLHSKMFKSYAVFALANLQKLKYDLIALPNNNLIDVNYYLSVPGYSKRYPGVFFDDCNLFTRYKIVDIVNSPFDKLVRNDLTAFTIKEGFDVFKVLDKENIIHSESLISGNDQDIPRDIEIDMFDSVEKQIVDISSENAKFSDFSKKFIEKDIENINFIEQTSENIFKNISIFDEYNMNKIYVQKDLYEITFDYFLKNMIKDFVVIDIDKSLRTFPLKDVNNIYLEHITREITENVNILHLEHITREITENAIINEIENSNIFNIRDILQTNIDIVERNIIKDVIPDYMDIHEGYGWLIYLCETEQFNRNSLIIHSKLNSNIKFDRIKLKKTLLNNVFKFLRTKTVYSKLQITDEALRQNIVKSLYELQHKFIRNPVIINSSKSKNSDFIRNPVIIDSLKSKNSDFKREQKIILSTTSNINDLTRNNLIISTIISNFDKFKKFPNIIPTIIDPQILGDIIVPVFEQENIWIILGKPQIWSPWTWKKIK